MMPLLGAYSTPDLHVVTWNIRRRIDLTWPPADRWAVRKPRLRAVLSAERPAVLCLQEVMPDQARAIADALGDRYRFVGQGRGEGGRGEGCPIFYDTRRLELVGSVQSALSETPQVAGSTSWGNMTPRIVVHAVLRERTTGDTFSVVNTHLDHISARSRSRSATAVAAIVAGLDHPAVVTGDLNAGPDSPAVTTLLAGGLRDAWAVAERRVTPRWDTFAGYHRPRIARGPIDWILTTDGVRVRRVGVDDRTIDGAHPSDHLSVHALIDISSART